jgi:sugar/nucleoside kinase (ribokinase family)
MTNRAQYDIVCIGNYTKDTIINPRGTTYVDGGAVNYAAHAAARLGLKTAVVTRLSQEDRRVVEKLRREGIDCFATYTPASTCMKLEYPTLDPDVRKLSVATTAGSITASAVSSVHARAAVIGSSFRGEVGMDVVQSLRQTGCILALDVQGFVRVLAGQELTKQPWEDMTSFLAQVDILKADAMEAEFLTGEIDVHRAAAHLAQHGPREIVLTHRDGLLIYADQCYYDLQFYAQTLNGRSGRGDTCLGGYVAMRLSEPPREAGIWAAALTSLKMEKQGPFDRTRADIEELICSKYNGSSQH